MIYKTEHNAVGRFPEPGEEALVAGVSRDFQVFAPLDFLAEVTQHIPDAGEHLIRSKAPSPANPARTRTSSGS